MSDKSDTPRTGLGEALEALRSKALAKGMRTLSMDEIEACLGGYYELQSELSEKDAALRKAEAELSALKSRLEVDPRHSYDGIDCRDATIKLQDERIAKLEADNAALRLHLSDKNTALENEIAKRLKVESERDAMLSSLRVAVESDLGSLWVWPDSAKEQWMKDARAAIDSARAK